MKKQYRIKSITHSGRKGIRGTPVTDEKYRGMIDCLILLDTSKLRQYDGVHWEFIDHKEYDWWNTSATLAASINEDKLTIETANTIYEFEEVDNEI